MTQHFIFENECLKIFTTVITNTLQVIVSNMKDKYKRPLLSSLCKALCIKNSLSALSRSENHNNILLFLDMNSPYQCDS